MTTLAAPKAKGFGTFSGVFLPSVLTIFGVILYMRMGWIVGVGGLTRTLSIISLSTLITLITSLSLSSTATNMHIGSGGVYFVLSRTFGLKIGSAVGIPLFFAQALSISFYVSGFAEAAHDLFPLMPLKTLGIVTLLFVTILALISTTLALRTQLLIFIFIIISLVSFFMGGTPTTTASEVIIPKIGFWPLFTLFFPAVTGIEAGLSMSGELKNPSRSLPLGTLGAVLIGYISYIAITLFMSSHISRELLVSHPMIMQETARFGQLVVLGIWGATLSSSLSCMLSAPRTLGALSSDGIAPRWICKDFNSEKSPRIAILLTAIFSALGLFLGSIDQIAPVLSMFFLISYGMLNFATAIEGMMGNPSYRPTFRTPWFLSLFGMLLCFTVMLMINAGSTLIALTFIALVYLLAHKRKLTEGWDDIRQAILLYFSRHAVYTLAGAKPSAKSWRPNLLVFIENPFVRQNLIELTRDITHGQGFLICASVHQKSEETQLSSYREKMAAYLQTCGISALVENCSSDSLTDGMKTFIKTSGIGPLTPNTVVLGATRKSENFTLYAEIIRLAHLLKKNVVIVREPSLSQKKERSQIDVWWGGLDRKNSELMLVLAYMLQTSSKWTGATLSLKTIVTEDEDRDPMLERLKEFSQRGRLHITPEIITRMPGEEVFGSVMKRSSQNADLVFLGLRPPAPNETPEEYGRYYGSLLEKTAGFPTIAFVLASEDIDFNKIIF